jgi:hypothetical protein
MAIIDFGGTKEEVVTRKEFPMAKARQILKKRQSRSLAMACKAQRKP